MINFSGAVIASLLNLVFSLDAFFFFLYELLIPFLPFSHSFFFNSQ